MRGHVMTGKFGPVVSHCGSFLSSPHPLLLVSILYGEYYVYIYRGCGGRLQAAEKKSASKTRHLFSSHIRNSTLRSHKTTAFFLTEDLGSRAVGVCKQYPTTPDRLKPT